MKITREQLKSIVGEVLQEEKDYQAFFQAMLKKHGVSSPDEFKTDDEKKAFFNKIQSSWNEVSEKIKSWKEAKWNEAELSAAQQKIDLNKNGKVDGDDLAKLRAGTKTEGEEKQVPSTQIISKEGETLVKSGKGNMYNITKVNEAKLKEGIWPKSKLASPFQMQLSSELKKKFKGVFYSVGYDLYHNDKKVLKIDGDKDSINSIIAKLKKIIKEGKLTEGRYDADLDKIEVAVKNATSFMNVGTELKKIGVKYDFTTSMIPMYMIKVSGSTIAICNKKYAAGAEREVKDIAIGLLN